MVRSLDDARRQAATARGRIPPHDLQAEESLLGAMLLSRDAIVEAVQICTGEDFYKPAHGHVFEAVCSLYGQGEPADPVTVADELRRADLLEPIGGLATLVSLQANTPATSNARRYAQIVEEHALLRRLIGVAGEIAELGYELPEDVSAAVDRAESLVFEVAQRRVTTTTRPLRELLADQLDRLEALYERGESITGIPSGYTELDEMLAGFQPSNLIIVGARPSMGKCAAHDTRVVHPASGAVTTLAELHMRGTAGEDVEVLSLGADQRLRISRPSTFVDDGVKPVYRVRTRLGREVRVTLSHPFLTPTGWRPLADIAVGTRIAVPRALPVEGSDPLPEAEIVLLAYLLGDGGLTGSSPRLTTTSPAVLADATRCAAALGVSVVLDRAVDRAPTYRLVTPRGQPNPLTQVLCGHRVMGKSAHQKSVPEAVFRLPRKQLGLFLSRLFATDGSAWWTDSGRGYGRISYSSVSSRLIHDVQHLLLRFGLNARIRRRLVLYRGERRPAFELQIMGAEEICRFAEEIGIFAKESALDRLVAEVCHKAKGYTRDSLPVEIREQVLAAKGQRSWSSISSAAGKPVSHNWHAGARSPRRETVSVLAGVLGDEALDEWSSSDIYWDTVVSIGYDGDEQVYDLTVPGDHNFVAADIFLHNTALALGIAAHAAMDAQVPVLLFSLEMSHLEITQRLLCSEARVDAQRMRTGKLHESDWSKVAHAMGRLGEAPVFIDDNPNITVMDIRAKARRQKAREGLGLVIVDYLQLMSSRARVENRQLEVSEISRNLKILARELEVPVIALSQLSRNLEARSDKRPVLADLRESGCMPAATRLTRADTGEEVTLGELVLSQEQPLVWSLDDRWRLTPQRLTRTFPSGVRPVFRLRLLSGYEVDATANHPFRTVKGWTRLDQLEVGDFLAVPRRLPAPLEERRWDEDEIVLLAHLLGDGSMGPGVKYATSDPANKAAVEEAALRRFGIEVSGSKVKNTWQLWLPSPYRLTHGRHHPVRNWLEPLGLWGARAHDKFVPEELFGNGEDQVRLFLRHLWATDGSITLTGNGRGNYVTIYYSSTSHRLSIDVRRLLLRLGIRSRLSRGRKVGYRDGWNVRVEGAHNLTRFLNLVDCHGQRGECVPEALRILEGIRQNPNVGDRELTHLATSDVFWDEIVEVVALGPMPTLDATVEGTHNFIADGVIAHNSIEQDADVVMFIYRDEVYNPESADRGTAEVLVAKHRNGPTGKTELAFLGQYTRFANMARL